jgi:uncharacterized membrane protein YkvA (DUF1232 family)
MLDGLARDVAGAWRSLHRSPGYALAVVLTLALGIGANAAIFSVVRGVLLGAVAYFVLPADMIPDLLGPLGFTDDASVIAAAIAAVGSHLQPIHRAQARDRLEKLAE